MEDWEKYADEYGNIDDDGVFEEQLQEWIREQSDRDKTVIVDPVKYAEMFRVIGFIESRVREKLAQWLPATEAENYDEDGNFISPKLYTPEFAMHFHNPVFSSSVGFEVLIPEIGIDFTIADLDDIVDAVPGGTVMNLTPKRGGFVSLSFSFNGIQSVIYND